MLYRLEEPEQAMLVYLSTRAEARDVLDQLPLSELLSCGSSWTSRSVRPLRSSSSGSSESSIATGGFLDRVWQPTWPR